MGNMTSKLVHTVHLSSGPLVPVAYLLVGSSVSPHTLHVRAHMVVVAAPGALALSYTVGPGVTTCIWLPVGSSSDSPVRSVQSVTDPFPLPFANPIVEPTQFPHSFQFFPPENVLPLTNVIPLELKLRFATGAGTATACLGGDPRLGSISYTVVAIHHSPSEAAANAKS